MLKLERMELSGFKSFQERTEILFDQGVTAVVGPNGCGKSNILDAMCWVLGEQSVKTLRGSAMVDLIFNGSQNRRPVGMAEVTLRLRATNGDLPNGDKNVALTRKLFRSGEAVYEVNGTPCRLKDIQNILYGSGLGVKAYSFIEQGRIGAILSAKPLDRRALIEEAAGITKFRVKKREAELKLEGAEQNLLRVRDIIAEVEKQMGTLKRQAAKARRSGRVKDELVTTLSELYQREHHELTARLADAAERWSRESDQRVAMVQAVAEAEGEVDSLRLAIDKQESAARGTGERLHETALEVDRNRNLIVTGRERCAELEERAREISEGLAVGRARLSELMTELGERRAAWEAAREREAAAREALDVRRAARSAAELAVAAVEARLEFAAEAKLAVVRQVADAGNALASGERLLAQLGERERALTTEDVILEAEERSAVASALALGDELAALEAQAADLANNVRAGFAEAQRTAEERDATKTRVERARMELQGSEERARALARITASAEDAGAATAVAAQILGEGALGLVADRVIAEPQYERAAGAALDALLAAIVVRSQEGAMTALAQASAAGDGVVRLLLLGAGDDESVDVSPLLSRDGVRGSLDQFVSVDPELRSALITRLRRVIVVDSLETAMSLAGAHPGLTFVTLAGEVAGPGGLLRAGSAGSGFLMLRREQREIESTLSGLRASLDEAEAAMAAITGEADGADGAARAAVDSLHEAEKALLGGRHRAAQAEDERRKKRDLLRAVRLEAAALAQEMVLAAGERDARARELAEAESRGARIDQEQIDGRRELDEVRGAASESSRALLQAEADFARAEETHKAETTSVVRLEGAVAERAREIAGLESERASTQDRGRVLASEVDAAEVALTGLFAEVAALEDRLRSEEAASRQLRHDLVTRDGGLKELRLRSEQQREKVQGIEIERTRLDGELAHLADRCHEELGKSLAELGQEPVRAESGESMAALDHELGVDADEDASVDRAGEAADAGSGPGMEAMSDGIVSSTTEELRSRAEVLRTMLARLGPVNELAVQEFQELRVRFEFMSGQARDLTESIESLVSTIHRINRTTRERFAETFEAVNRNFQETYVRLFGGGRAELRLTDEENLLETGIDIVAQPPGKRLQNILLLSGGEKALTAISLLFALFQYKPSPFCILDEVDAPLDEKNIDRFVGLLKTLSEGTQFILITHSPRTMRVADTLYGVTMEEPGVSRLVSVSLRELAG